jgi:choline-sulfatase
VNRRDFVKATGAYAAAMAGLGRAQGVPDRESPNVLLIMTDQQFGDLMSCVIGDKYLKTPNMDSLAQNGTRFARAYSPNPLCMPMRTSMITGRYPHETGIQSNGKGRTLRGFPTMGALFKTAGYETAYFGKWHIPMKAEHEFDTYVRKATLDPEPAAAFLRKKHKRPFFAVASFLSPHEICEWARKERLPGGTVGDVPPLAERPPLRSNCDPPENETDIMAYLRRSYHATGTFPVGKYTVDDWRRHIWGYYRLIERADKFVGVVMDALRESGQEENTLVVFLSDHGDCHGAHRWNQKTVFYDESARVPFIISQKGVTSRRTSHLLVNVGIDLMPTLLDFAGIQRPDGLPGLSLKDVVLGKQAKPRREYVVSQNYMAQGKPVGGRSIKPHGRMVRSERYKYCLYSDGQRRESLVDMQEEPGEMVNQAENPQFKGVLAQHRAYLREFAEKHKDAKALEMLEYIKETQ